MDRAAIAYWWRTTPDLLRKIPRRELRIMAEFMDRTERAREAAREAAKMGAKTPGHRGRPGPNDKIVDPKADRW